MNWNKMKAVAALLLGCMITTSVPCPTSAAEPEARGRVGGSPPGYTSDEYFCGEEGLSDSKEIEDWLQYIYIESPYLEAPGTQRVVCSVSEKTDFPAEVSLSVEDERGVTQEWSLKEKKDSLYLFESAFSEEDAGVFEIVGVNLRENGDERTLLLKDIGVDARFGVNELYEGISELEPLTGEAAVPEARVTVSTISEDGLVQGETSIEEALQEAANELEAGRFRIASSEEQETKASEVVVALDPGHDSTHAGAYSHGLHEEDLTLKIANYCKEELETYSGVSVYMTRTTAACPNPGSKSTGDDIDRRVKAAVKAGAKIYVSIHLNSSISGAAKGAEVIIQNDNWKPGIANSGRKLSEAILAELEALGLNNRGIYSKDSTISKEIYPDGSKSDYFTVSITSKEEGIPGIIVEHAFLSNSEDVNNFLCTEEGLKKLGVADAAGIAKYLELEKGNWSYVDGYVYYYEQGRKVYGEKKIGGTWYYFDRTSGAMQTGWVTTDTKKAYYDADGKMVYGEKKIDGKWYYFDPLTGAMATGFVTLPTKTVYYGPDGKMLYGSQYIDGKYYYFDPITGKRCSGWKTINGYRRYYDWNGQAAVGEKKIDGYWYFFDRMTGGMQTGWVDLNTKRVYYGPDGRMVYGERKIDGYWYFFHKMTGAMTKGFYQFPNKRVYYDAYGRMLYGSQVINGYYYYFDTVTGAMKKNWLSSGNAPRYYGSDGRAVTGEKKINGYWYCFGSYNACMEFGFQDLGNKIVYYNYDGRMVYGEKKIDGYWYYFHPVTGAMMTGFHSFPSKTVYYNSDGRMLYGLQKIGEYYYYFDPVTGKMYSRWKVVDGCARYFGSDGRAVTGERKIGGKWYFFDKGTGSMVTGFVRLPSKTVYYSESGAMLYGSQYINGNYYYFHPVTGKMIQNTYVEGDYYNEDGTRVHHIATSPSTTVDQMVRFYYNHSNSFPYNELSSGGVSTARELAKVYYEEAVTEGIDPAVAWCQCMLETGWLRFGNQVSINQFNFAGIGATDNGERGADFSVYGNEAARMGVRAQVQHLKAYAEKGITKQDLKNECVDPRFHLVVKGSAPYVEFLGMKENPYGVGWASGKGYGYNIVTLMRRLWNS